MADRARWSAIFINFTCMIFIKKITNRHVYGVDDGYPFDLPVIRAISEFDFKRDVTFFVGENGSGKSTLVEAIAVAAGFNPEGGTKNFNFATSPTHSVLYEELLITRGVNREQDGFFLRAESMYNVATEVARLGVSGYGLKPLHCLSHGQGFLTVINERFRGNGLYILDEPESALSLQSILMLMVRMKELVAHGSQFIIATHSPVLMAFPGAEIWSIDSEGLRKMRYEDTEQYSLTKYFLNNYEGFLKELFS